MITSSDTRSDIEATVADLIVSVAQRAHDAVALSAPGRTPATFGQLLVQIESAGDTLHRLGLGRNDRVAVVLPNGPEMATAFLTVASVAACAPLNPAYQQSEMEFYLSDLQARALIVLEGEYPAARDAARAQSIPIVELSPHGDGIAGSFSLSRSDRMPAGPVAAAAPDDVALVLHTSGTTSRPKIVPLTHRNLCRSALHIQRSLRLTEADCCLNVMPLFHIHGLVAGVLSSLSAGGRVVCTPGFDRMRFFDWLEELRPSWYTAVPTIHQAVLERANTAPELVRGHTLRLIRSSSSALPAPVMQELERVFDVPVVEAYGMTEAAHQMCSNPLPPAARKPGSVGPAAGPDVAVMDESGNLLPPNATGEIVIRGPNVFSGYEANPQANAAAWTNGWFRTGDQGHRDDEGYVILSGRIKELINRGGEKVSPREVDEVFLAHPAVAQAVAFAVPHRSLGEDIAVAVVPRAGHRATEQELRRFAFDRMAGFKVPSRVLFVEEIPKGPTGKLQRIGLCEQLASALEIDYVPPEGDVEDLIAGIFAEVLNLDRVGRNDNFFLSGGDSLSASRVLSRIRSDFALKMPLVSVFQWPTVAELAQEVESLLLADIEASAADESPSGPA